MIEHAALSDLGRKRPQNEDSVAACPEQGLFVVADGLGGHAYGEVASQAVTSYLAAQHALADQQPWNWLETALRGAHADLIRKGDENPEWEAMRTTCTTLYLDRAHFYAGHVGDSRLYLWRNGTLQAVTHDHTLVQSLLDLGEITSEQARSHPLRSRLTRALGSREEEPQPQVYAQRRFPGDMWLLCTDGLFGVLDDAEIAELLTDVNTPAPEVCRRLVEAANAAGGPDNISVVFVRDVVSPPETKDEQAVTSPGEDPEPAGSAGLLAAAPRQDAQPLGLAAQGQRLVTLVRNFFSQPPG